MHLNIAAICPTTKVLGPGNRFVLWVQGCCFSCENCGSPDWRPIQDAMRFSPAQLAKMILSTPGVEGITISGGEPMLQVYGLSKMLRLVRAEKNLSTICYTGFTLESLHQQQESNIEEFLKVIDVLIDGPYIDKLNDNLGWRGSSNQRVHFLSERYADMEKIFYSRKRDIEIHLLKGHYLMVGIPPKNLNKNNINL